ncbi:MAG: chlorophyll a/b-binding protein [Microcoleaceae cyanobacterium]
MSQPDTEKLNPEGSNPESSGPESSSLESSSPENSNPEGSGTEPTSSQPVSSETESTEALEPAPAFGWTSYAERINGRFAMVGFVLLVLLEAITHQDLFTWLGLR